MKRDFDLIRDILLDVEENAKLNEWYYSDLGKDDNVVLYHYRLLSEAGFVNMKDMTTKSGDDYRITGITYSGHEFLDQIRQKTVWEKTKKITIEKVGSLTFEAIKTISAEVIAKMITQ